MLKPMRSPFLAIAAALLVGDRLILLTGKNPLTADGVFFTDSLTNYYSIDNTLTETAPLLLVGFAVQVALKAGQFNIGAEGQIDRRGLGSPLVGLSFPRLSRYIHLPFALLAGFLVGALWGFIPGYLNAMGGVNPAIAPWFINYIDPNFVGNFVENPLREPGDPSAYSPLLQKTAWLPIILPKTSAHAGILVGLIAAVIIAIGLARSP